MAILRSLKGGDGVVGGGEIDIYPGPAWISMIGPPIGTQLIFNETKYNLRKIILRF